MTSEQIDAAIDSKVGWELVDRLHQPKWHEDLNAVHEVVNGFDIKTVIRYCNIVKKVVQDRHYIPSEVDARRLTAIATAEECCEALLRMWGLWKADGTNPPPPNPELVRLTPYRRQDG